MPQIWVTHAELARFSKIAAAEIEAKTHVLKWPRRNCSDGQVRIKLPDGGIHPNGENLCRATQGFTPFDERGDQVPDGASTLRG